MTPEFVAGRYRVRSKLGEGGMGSVWLAWDERLERDVALKMLVFPHGYDAEQLVKLRRRVLREAQTLARVDHPHVVEIFDVFEEEAVPWIVMKHIKGRSLYHVIRESPAPLAERRIAWIGLRVLRALRAVHREGVLHRDVKPANIVIDQVDGRTDEVFLVDFGIATNTGGDSVTRTTSQLGTPLFMAPERLLDNPVGEESDLWSLGATLYNAVEGHPPFDCETLPALIAAIMYDPPAPFTRTKRLRTVISSLLEKDPARRMGAEEAEWLLSHLLADQTPQPAPPPPTPPPEPSPVNQPGSVDQPTARTPFGLVLTADPDNAAEILSRMPARAAGDLLDSMVAELGTVVPIMARMPPRQAAVMLAFTRPVTAIAILDALPPSLAAGILAGMEAKAAGGVLGAARTATGITEILALIPPTDVGKMLAEMGQPEGAALLLRLPPARAAIILRQMAGRPAGMLLGAMSRDLGRTAKILTELPPGWSGTALERSDPQRAAGLLAAVEPVLAGRILGQLSPAFSVEVIRCMSGGP